ncbi:hypothetical protein [Nocardioides bruguierae]|uniref:hypothetical protein n=1 Tax=Nocardioides bruguierae TaxID=2945102 RepID=UPI002020E5FB|nr:hypothetical protein [Nocardioides bruguierae]MCL8024432.1 hypothetical protein [Nocardioides bruguierae]
MSDEQNPDGSSAPGRASAAPGAGPSPQDPGTPAGRPGRWRALVSRAPVRLALLVAALGLAVQAGGYAVGWAGHPGLALVPYYAGLVAIIVPFGALLTAPGLRARQRFAGAQLLGLTMWLSWFLSNPVMATRFDETLHVRTLLDLLEGEGLFTANSMLPVSPYYPGLELMAAAVRWTTGLPTIVSIGVVDAGSRAVLVAALFALGTLVGRLAQRWAPADALRPGSASLVGGLAVLLYAASPQFYFFNAQFAYQTPALALSVAAVVLLVRALQTSVLTGPRRPRLVLLGTALVAVAATAVTHHLTSWLLLATLWALAALLGLEARRVRADEQVAETARLRARTVLVVAELGTVLAAAWTTVVAPLLLTYLAPIFDTTGSELVNLVTLNSTGSREVLADTSGSRSPLWEIAVMALSILLWLALLVPALWSGWRGRLLGPSRARLLLLAIALVYPALYAVRFFPTAAEVADRATTFVCLGTAVLAAVWVAPRLASVRNLVVPAVLVMLLGGVMLGGGPDWQRVPGPYLAGAEQRSVDAGTVAVARWAGRYLPAGSRIVSDLTLDRVIPDFAPVDAVTKQSGGDNMTPVFIDTSVDDEVLDLLTDNDVDFLVVDERIIGQKVLSNAYFEAGASYGDDAQQPNRQMLTKFRGVEGFDVVYDDGDVVVYDVRSLRGEDATFADRADPGLPGDADLLQSGLVLLGAAVLAWWRRRYLLTVLRHPRRSHLVAATLVLPVAVVVGLLGSVGGYPPVQGALVLLLLALAAILLRAGRGDPPAEPAAPWRERLPGLVAGGLAVVLLVGAGTLAALSARHALLDEDLQPAPTASSTSSSAGSSGTSDEGGAS